MNNNDVLKRIRYIFDYSDRRMIAIFAAADVAVTREQVNQWLKKEDDVDYKSCRDETLAIFLNGLINVNRGRRQGEQAKPEKKLNNNLILKKLKIALNLSSDGILDVLAKANLSLSQHELSAFFRKPGHKHYRECKDQVLRNFLNGLQITHRGGHTSSESVWGKV